MLTLVAVQAVDEMMDRETEDRRLFQFSASTDKGQGAYIWKLFKEVCRNTMNRPNLVVHNIRLENATQLADRGIEDELRQRQPAMWIAKCSMIDIRVTAQNIVPLFIKKSFLNSDNETTHPSKH